VEKNEGNLQKLLSVAELGVQLAIMQAGAAV
jgi:hypothetical protein